jgi:predicted nuclease with TOPRIM domain
LKGGLTKTGDKKDLPEENFKNLEEKMANLEQANQKLHNDYEAAKAEANKATDDAKTLKAKFDALEKAKHEGLVADTLKARADAGLADKEETEKTLLAALSDEALAVLHADALKVASITQTQTQALLPSVKYEGKAGDSLLAAVNEQRLTAGLPALKELN